MQLYCTLLFMATIQAQYYDRDTEGGKQVQSLLPRRHREELHGQCARSKAYYHKDTEKSCAECAISSKAAYKRTQKTLFMYVHI